MEHIFEKLEVLITREISVYGDLLELSLREKDAIIANGLPDIDAIIADKQALLKNLKQLESERKELFCSFSQITSAKRPSYRAIIDKANGAVRQKLAGFAAQLEDTADELKRVNALNKALLDTQVKYTSFFMNLITGASDKTGTYSNSGRLNDKGESRSLLDQTI